MAANSRNNPPPPANGGGLLRQYWPVAAVTVIGLAMSWLGFEGIGRNEDARVRSVLLLRADWRTADLQRKILEAPNIVMDAAAFVASTHPTLEDYRGFLEKNRQPSDATRVVLWAPMVRRADRAAFEAEVSRVRGGPFKIVHPDRGQGAAVRWIDAPDQPEYAPILLFMDFTGRTAAILGIDQFYEATRRTLGLRAAREGRTLATPPLALTARADDGPGFTIIAPVYPPGPVPGTPEERLARVVGFSIGTFAVETVLKKAIEGTPGIAEAIRVYIAGENDPATARHVASYDAGILRPENNAVAAPPEEALNRVIRSFDAFGQRWTLAFDFSDAAIADLRSASPWLWLMIGTMLTGLTALYLVSKQRQMALVEATVRHRTRDLAAANDALRLEGDLRAERERRLGAAQLINQRIFETSVDLILVADRQGTIVQVSPSVAAILGYAQNEMAGRSAADFLHAPDLDATRNEMREARRRKEIRRFECRYNHKNGTVVRLAWAGVWSESDRQYFFIGRDMTASDKAQADLREAKEMFAAIIDASPEAILCLDPRRNVLIWNRAAERIFGYSAAETLHQPYKLVPQGGEDEYDDLVERAMRGERLHDIRVVRTRKDGAKRQVSFSCAPLYGAGGKVRAVIYVLQDVTERNLIEQQLRQSQKLEAVGQLTGGLAHDFNNLLGVVIGNLDLVIETADPKKQETQFLKSALEASMRGAELVRRLMLFSRRQPLNPSVFAVNEAIEEFASLLRRALGEAVELEVQFGEAPARIATDKHQFENALMNLCVNARDAMPSGGVIRIETANVAIDAASASLYPDMASGNYISVSVTDNGTGIAPENLQKVFEPFFTTKSEGKGTGLGLSMVYGFMRESSGMAKIYSELGHGTTVRLYFPRTDADMTDETGTEAAAVLPTGNELILVVEDRVDVRAVAVAVLERLGYRVLEAENVAAALAVLNSGAKIDLVFSDIVMPGGLTGLDLAQEIRKRGLKAPILLTSGYASPQVLREQAQKMGLPLIGKPYRVADLAAKVRAMLDGRNGKNGHNGRNGKG